MLRQPMSKLPLLTLVLFALACDGSHAAPVAKGPQRSGRKFDVAPVPCVSAVSAAAAGRLGVCVGVGVGVPVLVGVGVTVGVAVVVGVLVGV